jgi:hypothetical protein
MHSQIEPRVKLSVSYLGKSATVINIETEEILFIHERIQKIGLKMKRHK